MNLKPRSNYMFCMRYTLDAKTTIALQCKDGTKKKDVQKVTR